MTSETTMVQFFKYHLLVNGIKRFRDIEKESADTGVVIEGRMKKVRKHI